MRWKIEEKHVRDRSGMEEEKEREEEENGYGGD